jgi:hypothetical protein
LDDFGPHESLHSRGSVEQILDWHSGGTDARRIEPRNEAQAKASTADAQHPGKPGDTPAGLP